MKYFVSYVALLPCWVLERLIISSYDEARILQKNKINTMAVNTLAPHVTRSSTTMILTT